MPPAKPDREELLEQIRTNWAFEHLLVSVLAGAGVAGALTFVIALGAGVLANAPVVALTASAFFKALVVTFLVFLVGFLSGVLVIAPLFRAMERAKRRGAWTYVAAALAIAVAALALISNLPNARLGFGVAAPVIVSSIVISVLFTRRMKPLWRAAERAEADAASGASANLKRLS